MNKISKYTKLGILVIACLAIFIWGINFLKGIDILKRNTTYFVIYNKIDGLLKSSSVTINGYQIGQVSDIAFANDYSGKLIVTILVQEDFKIAKGSVARIVSSDIMGTKSVKIDVVHSGEYYHENDTIPGDTESDLKEQVSMQVLPLKKKAEELIAQLDSAMTVVTYIFNRETRENLKESFENINLTVANIQATSAELNKIVGSGRIGSIVYNIDSITSSINSNSVYISNMIRNFSALSDSLAKIDVSPVFEQISGSIAGINAVLQKLNSNDGTAGMLFNDPALYQNITNLSNSLDMLLKDVRNNPKRYVHFSALNFGKDVYVTAKPNQTDKKDDIVFKVHLISSPSKLTKESSFFKGLGPIEEIKISEIYNYMAGNTSDYGEISILLDLARNNFPDANLVAFKNGHKVDLAKAIKKQLN